MPDDAKAIEKEITTRESDFRELWERMDDDFDSWKLVSSGYDTTIDVKTKEHESDIKIISNDPRTNCDDVQSILSSAERQIIVRMAETGEGEDKREDIGKLERLFEFLLQKGDERLIRLLLPPLRESLIWYSLVRGWVAGRFLTYEDDGDVTPDYMALDPRWLTYEIGKDGMLWTSHKTFRSKAALESEYGEKIKTQPWFKPWGETNKNIAVRDYWKYEGKESITNSVICNGRFLKEPKEYKLTSHPILVMPVTTRPPVSGREGVNELKGYGESIFAPTRDINGIRNRFVTMVASHANMMANQALINYKGKQGKSIPKGGTMNVPGGIIELTLGENNLMPSPLQEVSPTVIELLNWLSSRVQRGMLPDIPIDSPPPSGTLYNLVQEQGNKIFNPQLRNLNYFYADILRLTEEQMIADKISIEIEGEDKQRYFKTKITPVDLKKPHIIKVEFTARTPWTQMDTAQIAQMLRQSGVPEGWIWENIYKFQDPKGMQDLAAIELFEKSPKGAMATAVVAFMKRGQIDMAQSLIRDMDRLEAQEEVPIQEEIPPQRARI